MHVVVTGASSGIGRELARAFHRGGATVTLVARRAELLDVLAAELGDRCGTAVVDLAARASDPSWLGEVEHARGPIDVLVNNAGVHVVGATVSIAPEDAEAAIRLNLLAPLLLTRAVLPGMLRRGSGTIVDVASMAGVAPAPGMSWYGATKAGLVTFSESLRHELAGTGVHVVTVYPGPIDTPMADAMRSELTRLAGKVGRIPHGDPRILAERVVRAVVRRQARVIYPWFHRLRFAPWLGRWLTVRAAPRIDPRGARPGE